MTDALASPGAPAPSPPPPSPPPRAWRVGLIDRYLLRLTLLPLLAALAVTLTALLLERAVRLLDVLAASNGRAGYVVELLGALLPYYLGLTLPAAFFLALFVVFSRLSDGSEIDALLAAGVSLDRVAAPCLALGAGLAALSLLLSGFVQPAGRYAYRALLHAAQTDGWNGRVQSQVFVSPSGRMTLTAEHADVSGRELRDVFIREVGADGREKVTTARAARLRPEAGGRAVMLSLTDGQQVRRTRQGEPQMLEFRDLDVELPLPPGVHALRPRGEDERELTAFELARGPHPPQAPTPRRRRLAELYGQIARALALPLLPLLALPLSLAAKRGGRVAGVLAAALLLVVFQHLLQLGQSLGASGKAPALLGVGLPFALFAGLCLWIFLSSRTRPGETPVGGALGWARDRLARLRPRLTPARERAPA